MKTLDDIPPVESPVDAAQVDGAWADDARASDAPADDAWASDAPADKVQAGSAHQDLEAYLGALERDANYHVERRLGSGEDGTVTELVRFMGANGSAFGPFVRKRIPLDAGVGTIYEDLFGAQRAGRRFLHIPRIVECYKTSFELVVVSEYVPGESLAELVGRDGPGDELARRVMPALCEAVVELHESFDPPIIHRDLKPGNIIVSGEDVTLIDFGIARRFRADAGTDTVRFGTRAYAPPEQYGFGQTSVRSDVYALGIVLVFCCLGVTLAAPVKEEDLIARGVDPTLARIAARACAFDPASRFATAREMGESLRAAAASLGMAGQQALVQVPASPGSSVAAAAGCAQSDAAARAFVRIQAQGIHSTALPTRANRFAVSVPATKANRPGALRSLLSRTPFAVGIAWDIFIVICAIIAMQAGIESTMGPQTGALAGKPFWYVVAINWLLVAPIVLGGLYLAMDRRPLHRLVPALAARTRAADARVLGFYLICAFVAVLAAALVAGI